MATMTAEQRTIDARLVALGFVLTGTGGNCTAYERTEGEVIECLTVDGEPLAPTELQDRVTLATSDDNGETWDSSDTERVPLWALLEALEIAAAMADQWGSL